MPLKWITECLPFFLIGAYILISAIVAKSFVNESDVPATDEERLRAKATPLGRVFFFLFGAACIIYAIICSRKD